MDLRLFWAVAKRYKRISIGGTVLAAVLAIFAYGTPGPHGIKPRGSVTWESDAQLLLMQGNGTYTNANPKAISSGATGYMESLTPIYAALANGTAVQNAVAALKMPGKVTATEAVDPLTGLYEPWVNLAATAPSEASAAALIQRAVPIFQNYVNHTEAAAGIPPSGRISLAVLKTGLPPKITSKIIPTIPILIFIAIFAGTIMLMFSLENRDPKSAAALGRVPAGSTHREGHPGGIGPIMAPAPHAGSAGHVDHLPNGAHDATERRAVVDRLTRG